MVFKKMTLSLTWILLIHFLFSTPLLAQDVEETRPSILDNVYVGAGLGYSFFETAVAGPNFTVDNTNDIGARLLLGFDTFRNLSFELSLTDFGSSLLSPNGDVDHLGISLSANLYISPKSRPVHLGYSTIFKVGVEALDMSTTVDEVAEIKSQFTLGVGFEYALNNGFAIQGTAQTLYKSAGMFSINMLYRFGYVPQNIQVAKPRTNDFDADGIKDEADQCPKTQPRRAVDDNGCEFDEDKDGIYDGDDRCPSTPEGARVNSRGCPYDTDGDGVSNLNDDCQSTPSGVQVDKYGCELDTDIDGVVDSRDLCPGTQIGEDVNERGCSLDEDRDGVVDNYDACPSSPFGEPVDKNGCTIDGDKDGDGVMNSIDTTGTTIKNTQCSPLIV